MEKTQSVYVRTMANGNGQIETPDSCLFVRILALGCALKLEVSKT